MQTIQTAGNIARARRRSLDPRGYTRAQALRKLGSLTEPEQIASFAEHPNKHVRRFVAVKVGRSVIQFLGNVCDLPNRIPFQESKIWEEFSERGKALAEAYGETVESVREIFLAVQGDVAGLKRRLISRKAARTRKAAKEAAA